MQPNDWLIPRTLRFTALTKHLFPLHMLDACIPPSSAAPKHTYTNVSVMELLHLLLHGFILVLQTLNCGWRGQEEYWVREEREERMVCVFKR